MQIMAFHGEIGILRPMDQSTEKPPEPAAAPADDVRDNKDIAAFSYLWIMSVIVFMLRGKSPFVRYHSKQAMLLFFLSIPVWFIPFGIGRVLELVILGCMVLGFMHAAQGEWKDIPLIGPLSRREMTVREAWRIIVSAAASFARSVSDMARSKNGNAAKESPTPPPPASPAAPADAPPSGTPPPAPPASL